MNNKYLKIGLIVCSLILGTSIAFQVAHAGDLVPISRGGGGSGSGTFSTSTSQVSGQLTNHPNNNSDIVTIGATATSSAKFSFDPNTSLAVLTGLASLANASSTQLTVTGATWLTGIGSLGGVSIGSNGKVYSSATTTAGTGLTYTSNSFNVNNSQSISTLSNLGSNGFVKTSGGTGALSVDTTSYTPTTRTLTINGTAFDLSADRSWTISTGGGTGTVGTSTNEVAGGVGVWTTTSGTPALLGQFGNYASNQFSVANAQGNLSAPELTASNDKTAGISFGGSKTFSLVSNGRRAFLVPMMDNSGNDIVINDGSNQNTRIKTLVADSVFSGSTGILTLGKGVVASASSTLQDFTGVNATTTSATSTNMATTNLCISGDCRAAWPSSGGGVWPFVTTDTNYGVPVQSTSTPEWYKLGLFASSTSQIAYASTTAISANTVYSANFVDTAFSGNNCVGESSGIIGQGTNCVSSIASAGGSLTVSSPTGNVDVSLNAAHANTFSALQTFANASSTLWSSAYASSTNDYVGNLHLPNLSLGELAVDSLGNVYKGATSTLSTISGLLTLTSQVTGVLPIANGGTNAASFTTTGNAAYYDGTRLLTAPLTSAVTTPYASSTGISSVYASSTIGNIGTLTLPNTATPAGTFLAADATGKVIATSTPTGSSGAPYPFNVATNATTTIVRFNGGLTAQASSTVGDGTQAGGLTIAGGATTTGNVLIGSATASTTFSVDSLGHIMTGGTQPTCGTGCSTVVGDDNSMRVVTGTTITTATVNFANTWKNSAGVSITPTCTASEESAGTITADASSTPSTVILEFASALTATRIAVQCMASDNFSF